MIQIPQIRIRHTGYCTIKIKICYPLNQPGRLIIGRVTIIMYLTIFVVKIRVLPLLLKGTVAREKLLN